MKKKFTSNLKEKQGLPLPLYFLEKNNQKLAGPILKFEKARKINSEGYELYNFYKTISKF